MERFYCCSKLKQYISATPGADIKAFNYCPWCKANLSKLDFTIEVLKSLGSGAARAVRRQRTERSWGEFCGGDFIDDAENFVDDFMG